MTFSCTLIGSDTLLIECGQMLLDKGHSIRTVVTDTDRVEAWASSKGLEVLHPKADDLVAQLTDRPYDYLFAITYLALLPDEVLATADKMAINFHDGPLPTYAGLNTPAWALLNREPEHGISWHEITAGIDEGDLLKQVRFEISASETSLSLNTRNFAAAIESFDELIVELDNGGATKTAQEGQKGYWGRHTRPTQKAAIDFHQGAGQIDALVRACDFGVYPNSFASPTLVAGDKAFIVQGSALVEYEGDASPGTVVSLSDDRIVIACEASALALTRLASLTGRPQPLAEVASELALKEGSSLPALPTAVTDALGERSESISKAERFWTRRLIALEPLELPWSARESASAPKPATAVVDVADAFKAHHGDDLDDALAAAVAVYLGRVGGKSTFHLAHRSSKGLAPLLSDQVPVRIALDPAQPFAHALDAWKAERARCGKRDTFLIDALARAPETAGRFDVGQALLPVGLDVGGPLDAALKPGAVAVFRVEGGELGFAYDAHALEPAQADQMAAQLAAFIASAAAHPDKAVGKLGLLTDDQRQQLLQTWNATDEDVEPLTVHDLFLRQVEARPDDVAVRCEGTTLTYRQLDERANAVARLLLSKGAGPDKLVGVHVDRSAELMVAVMGVLKSGAAYVPLDPTYPTDRIHYMVEDAGLQATLTRTSLQAQLPDGAPQVINIDELTASEPARPEQKAGREHLAYVIYTSGSTGKPKGVMVEHRNAVNFFVGMDAVVPHEPPGKWLAVTSLSFDISVLELLWTLTRGFEVLLYRDTLKSGGDTPRSTRPMEFGLFYWGNDDGEGRQKYRLLLEGAKFADTNGFQSVWTPERHFHAFGGPYPNPAVTGAAVAAVTQNISVRSGSCVVPLHHPARIAEEWAVIDNLSNGRAALSIASGWQPDDFLLQTQNYPGNKQAMFDNVEVVRALWRGEKQTFEGPMGPVEILTQPRPVQKELPIWVTTAGNPKTYEQAADLGGNVLTHLLGQSVDEVSEKVRIYRDALEKNGKDRASGKVTLMLHCFVGMDTEEVREIVRQPMKDYLMASIALVKTYAWAFPAFKKPEGAKSAMDVDLTGLSDEEVDAILEFAFERYFEDSGLFGDVDTCLAQIERLKAIEVDEIACLIDFGVPTQQVLDMLPKLGELRAAANDIVATGPHSAEPNEGEDLDYGIPALIDRHQVTHMQCTPSMARMLTTDTDTQRAVATLDHLFVGGEAFPLDLGRDLAAATEGTVRNMYGPTETTIWSSTEPVEKGLETLPIGKPIANTRLYILNDQLEPQPVGVPGALYIGGKGVVRGYLHRPELTGERFLPDPFLGGDERIYNTGDVARFLPDGRVDFIGRADHQVKIRGYRVELGEIESRLLEHPSVRVAAAIVREDTPGDQRLVAYVVAQDGAADEALLKDHCRERLPEYMVPQHVLTLPAMPQTPNKKIDRKALPPPASLAIDDEASMVAPTSEVEQTVAQVWCDLLGREKVGVDSNFFDLGGHSLLVVRLNRELKEKLERPVSLTDLYRFPTIRAFVESLESGGVSEQVKDSADRGARRREAMAKRRRRGRA